MMLKKKPVEDPIPIGKIAVMFRVGPVQAVCETDLMGYLAINLDDPENPVFDPDFKTLSHSVKTALKVLSESVDENMVTDIMEQLRETRADEADDA